MSTAVPPLIPSDSNNSKITVQSLKPKNTIGNYTTWKLPVRVTTSTNIVLNGLQIINSIQIQNGDRILVKDQINSVENGIYNCSSDNWYRSTDLINGSSAANISIFDNNSQTMFICVNEIGNDTIGINDIVFIEYTSGGTPGGLTGQVQFNNNGSFDGSQYFEYNGNPTTIPFEGSSLNVIGELIIGPEQIIPNPAPPVIGLIRGKHAENGSDAAGGSVLISGGTGDGIGIGGSTGILGGTGLRGGTAFISGGQGLTDNGGSILLRSGDGFVNGGTFNFDGGSGETGNGGSMQITLGNSDNLIGGTFTLNAGNGGSNGGDVLISSGFGTAVCGDIVFTASSNIGSPGTVTIVTNSLDTTFVNGGMKLYKEVYNIPNLSTLPIIANVSYRQGFINIIDPSFLGPGSSVTITVNNPNILPDDNVILSIDNFSGGGIPHVIVGVIITGSNFDIILYNLDTITPFSNNLLRIYYQLV